MQFLAQQGALSLEAEVQQIGPEHNFTRLVCAPQGMLGAGGLAAACSLCMDDNARALRCAP